MGERIYPIGRLDYASEGLLLMTNDGELANFLTKAASHVPKTYLVKVAGLPQEDDIEKLRQGIRIGSKPGSESLRSVRTAPAQVRLVRESDNPWYEVTLTQGKNRQIRRMFEEIGHHVEKIKRTRYGGIALDVEPGKFRALTEQEIATLRKSGGTGAQAAEPVPDKKLIKTSSRYIGKAALKPGRRSEEKFRRAQPASPGEKDDRYPRREPRSASRPGFGKRENAAGDSDVQGERPRRERPAFGDRPARRERPAFGDRPPRRDRPSFGDRPPRSEGRSFSDRAPRVDRPARAGGIIR